MVSNHGGKNSNLAVSILEKVASAQLWQIELLSKAFCSQHCVKAKLIFIYTACFELFRREHGHLATLATNFGQEIPAY